MSVTLPCRRLTIAIKCDYYGVCLLKRALEHPLMCIDELVDELANIIIKDHIYSKNCNDCRKNVNIISMFTSYS
uniref:Matrix protein 2-2 n=1 Tax=avian metapneumovirus TaxID=38525 RepID=A0A481Y9C9_9MONO|nr:matrix protein 2-2 [Avian metapneumovirus]